MNQIDNLSPKKTAINPLWIISLFFSFTEIVLGYAITKTEANVQTILTCFTVSFPFLVALAFFIILWFKPKHFYAPTDFRTDHAFLDSFRDSQKIGDLHEQIRNIINEKLGSAEVIKKLEIENPKKVLKDAAESIVNKIRDSSFITIDLGEFADHNHNQITVPYDNFNSFGDLIDAIFFKLTGVRPFHYGFDWVLKTVDTDTVVKGSGMIVNATPGVPVSDTISLAEAGIQPGAKLLVIGGASDTCSEGIYPNSDEMYI